MGTGCFSKSKSYVVRSDIKEAKNTPWQKVLAMVLFLVFAVAFVATLTLLLQNDETPNNAKIPSLTEIQTTSNTFIEPNRTIDTTLAMETSTTTNPISDSMSSAQTLRTQNPMSVQNMTFETTPASMTSTTKIQTTHFFMHGPNVTIGNRGTQFIVVFMKNFVPSTSKIFITSENGVQMNISTSPHLDPILKSEIDQNIDILSNIALTVPSALELNSFKKEPKSIFIETSDDVFIISHDDGSSTVGSTTHIPLHKLSDKYVVISTEPDLSSFSFKSQIAVAATVDNTTISITFKMKRNLPLNIEGNTYYSGDVFNFSLNRYETYQIAHETDLTGTFIESSAPIAAFSGNDCNKLENIGGCDHLIEQLPPTDSVDSIYIVPPNANNRGTLIRITAIESSNTTFVIGNVSQSLFINKLNHFDVRISSSQTCFITSDQPNLVTSFGLASLSSTLGDPSMTIVPGFNQYLSFYKIVVPSGYDFDYVSIMIKHSFKNSFRINGTVITTADIVFEEDVEAGNLTYNVRTIKVPSGELTAYTVDEEKFGLIFAGVSYYEAYGFSGNSLLL